MNATENTETNVTETEQPVVGRTAEQQAALDADVIAAENAVGEKEAAVKTAQEAVKEQTDANKDARKNVKQAEAYVKGLGERTDENAAEHEAGIESVNSWKAALEQGVKDLEAKRQAVKDARAAVGEAKKARTAAKKAAKPEGKAKRKASGGTRAKINDDTVLNLSDTASEKGIAGKYADAFKAMANNTGSADVKFGDIKAGLVEVSQASGSNSKVLQEDPERFVRETVSWLLREGWLTVVAVEQADAEAA
jgi:hypothetical protein